MILLKFVGFILFLFPLDSAAKDDVDDSQLHDKTIYACEKTLLPWGGQGYPICRCKNDTVNCSKRYLAQTNMKLSESTFNQASSNFTVLKTIEFFRNNLKALKKNQIFTGNEATVESLNFVYNKINEIQNGTFDNFVSLKILRLDGNQITSFHEGILTEKLGTTLEELSLGENPISPFNLSNLKNLKRLTSLSLSDFDNLDFGGSIFPEELTNLKYLSLRGCKISNLSDDLLFENLRSLEKIDLSRNSFTFIPKAIQKLTNLQNLMISENPISSISNEDFKLNKQLKKLDISYASLKEIENCTFCNLPNLKSLRLTENYNLSYIHENAFGSISTGIPMKLDKIDLECCNISRLSKNLLDWYSLNTIYIQNNPYKCDDCSMAWIFKKAPFFLLKNVNFGRVTGFTVNGKNMLDKCTMFGFEECFNFRTLFSHIAHC